MKSISQIIREIFAARNPRDNNPSTDLYPQNGPENNNQNPKNSKAYETETVETSRNPDVADTRAQETDPVAEQTGGTGNGEGDRGMTDGIPVFHGSPSNCRPMGDIFSMAREA